MSGDVFERGPQPGVRVRAVVEGVVEDVIAANGTFWVGAPGKRCLINTASAEVEILTPPEPEWRYGDVVRADCLGFVRTYIHDGGGFTKPGGKGVRICPDCRLTLLVRDDEAASTS